MAPPPPPPPPPCRRCKSRCASRLATGTLFGIYVESSFLHAAVINYMKLVTTILFLVLLALMHRVYIILLFVHRSSHAMCGQNSTSWPETLWPLRLLGAWYVSNVSIIFDCSMLLYYLFWMSMGFILYFYIIFGTNLLTGGPSRIAVFFCLFQCFEETEYQTESKRNKTFGNVIQETWTLL